MTKVEKPKMAEALALNFPENLESLNKLKKSTCEINRVRDKAKFAKCRCVTKAIDVVAQVEHLTFSAGNKSKSS